jgi:NADPH:quinone reductase-like Zn-dependent oxidoreductase
MKAAVIFEKGEMPQYMDIAEPTVQNEDEILVSVKAVALSTLIRARRVESTIPVS